MIKKLLSINQLCARWHGTAGFQINYVGGLGVKSAPSSGGSGASNAVASHDAPIRECIIDLSVKIALTNLTFVPIGAAFVVGAHESQQNGTAKDRCKNSLKGREHGTTMDLCITWLKPCANYTGILCPDYRIYGYDRKNWVGGGLLSAVKYSTTLFLVLCLIATDAELISVCLRLKDLSVYLTCPYIPLICDMLVSIDHLQLIQRVSSRLKPCEKFVVLLVFFGDELGYFITWSCSRIFTGFFDEICSLCHLQLNGMYNRKSLSLVWQVG
uniref:Uncharacterized protein n=1 Tax=Glossina austeni TaxID=7395 RepID=A0A1A9VEE6_GLOAU